MENGVKMGEGSVKSARDRDAEREEPHAARRPVSYVTGEGAKAEMA
jgi:hypothetical protein